MTKFSCDLVSNAKKHLQFLQDIHQYNTITFVVGDGGTNNNIQPPASIKELEALRRYRDLWLPFVAIVANSSNRNTDETSMIPPPDIAWLWHCHRLAPQEYNKYCDIFFNGTIIEANPPFLFARSSDADDDDEMKKTSDHTPAVAVTKRLWTETYPNEPFYLEEDIITDNVTTGKPPSTVNGYDLLGSARRQMAFLWQVSGERYAHNTFLKQGVKNYEKFLKLTSKANELGIILVPTYQIDLMWHTHILSSISDYNKDCVRIMKRHMYHDDSLTDREEGGTLDVSYGATQKLWKSVYGNAYVVHGGMYRGEPPSAYYNKKTWSCSSTTSSNENTVGQALIGKVGASSTSSNVLSTPKPWIPLDGTASDGRPAFIRTEEQVKSLIKDIPYRDPYVLCRVKRITGFYHIETKEAQTVLFYRMSDRLFDLKKQIMIEMCTCGLSRKSGTTPAKEKFKNLKVVCDTMQKQLFVAGTSNGATIPSDTMFTCAGGACGGAVALKGDSEYAAACGTVMTTYAGVKLGFAPV